MRLFLGNKTNPSVGTGRYAAEHWIHSHPGVMPCYLFNDTSYSGA